MDGGTTHSDNARDIHSFYFSTFKMDERMLLESAVAILSAHNIPTDLFISSQDINSLVAEIQHNYNNNPFHSFSHAVTVTQMMHLFLSKTLLAEKLNSKEKFCLLICMICHDLDHPGLSNGFQINVQSALTKRYNNKSVLENHHLARTMELLKTQELIILKAFSQEEKERFFGRISTLILSTDLACHFALVKEYETTLLSFSWENSRHREQLFVMLVKAADISNEVRPFDLSRQWARALMDEYFAQSDLEKMRGLPVTPFMDKDKVVVNQAQVNFIETFLQPTFELLHRLIPEMQQFIDNISANKAKWAPVC